MNRFKQWYVRNQDEITWFLIGFLTFAGFNDVINHNYGMAAFNFAMVYGNYKLAGIRLQ